MHTCIYIYSTSSIYQSVCSIFFLSPGDKQFITEGGGQTFYVGGYEEMDVNRANILLSEASKLEFLGVLGP